MGAGSYSHDRAIFRSKTYVAMDSSEIFERRSIDNSMNPKGVTLRESRDSADHPNSLAIILALDLTGSMGAVPDFLVKQGLPLIMSKIIEGGERDPQILFLGVGDHEFDQAPLQVGQFESSDELLNKWLTDVYLEGGGGGNGGESYLLAWFFAANYTAIDCFEKRGKKGFIFTIGDEPNLKELPLAVQRELMGDGQYSKQTEAALYAKASERYECFHIHLIETSTGKRPEYVNGWRELLGDHLITAKRSEDIAKIITETVLKGQMARPLHKPTTTQGAGDEQML